MASKYTLDFKRKLATERTPPKPVARTTTNVSVKSQANKDQLDTAFSLYSPTGASKYSVMARRSKSSTNICYTPKSDSTATPRSRNRLPQPETPDCFAPVSMETPRRLAKSSSDITQILDEYKADKEAEISNLKVAVRVRPMSVKECSKVRAKNCVKVQDNELTVLNGPTADGLSGKSFMFQYDQVFWSCNDDEPHYANQKCVYDVLAKPLVDSAFEGYNICVFAYGMTGSGKTYSMMGIDSDDPDIIGIDAGVIPRMCDDIFHRIEQLKENFYAEVEVSYFEIYNEKIHDLLTLSSEDGFINAADTSKKPPLKVREHPTYGPYVVDLSTHLVDSHKLLRNWLAVGNSQRATAATGMNDKSSRSHSIFNIVLNLTEKTVGSDDKEIKLTKRSKISLVDLAGSERVYHTKVTAERIKEGVSINKSLLTLGKVITALADSKKGHTFVPYRESVLTWLLRENLGGNSRTVMLATISPSSNHMDETLSTLRYACQARTIVNRVKVNEDPHDRVIRELKAEVERLKALNHGIEIQKRHSGASSHPRKIIIETSVDDTEVESLKKQLIETEKKLESWEEKMNQMEELRRIETKLLKKNGLALQIAFEQDQAYLVNLSKDLMKTSNLIYLLPKGTTTVGRSSTLCVPDIAIDGINIGNRHCTITNLSSSMYIVPSGEHETLLNGKRIKDRQRIYSGDRIVLGGSHIFRLVNQSCTNWREESSTETVLHDEMLRNQEVRIRHELEIEKRNEIRNFELEMTAKMSECHMKMNQMEQELRRFKSAVPTSNNDVDVDKIRRILEPYETALLDDIRGTFREIDAEIMEKVNIKIKNANDWCRNNSKAMEFKNKRSNDDFGLLTVLIEVIDRNRQLKTVWPLQRFDIWYESAAKGTDILPLLESNWTGINPHVTEAPESTPSTPRKALNVLSEIGKTLVRSPIQKIRSSFAPSETRARRTLLLENKENILNSLKENTFESEVMLCLIDIQAAAIRLRKMCKKTVAATADASLVIIDDDEDDVSDKLRSEIQKCSEQIEKLVHELNYVLTTDNSAPKSVRFHLDPRS